MTSPKVLDLTVGPMSHGGHCVARHQGRVVFVRHAIPGERVRAVVTEGGESAKFWRADTIDVLVASDHRRRHPWKQADSLRAYDHGQVPVGGADYGHISDSHQRRLKAQVFRDTLHRIGGIELSDLDLPGTGADGEVPAQALPGAESGGLHWRTRVSFAVVGGSLAMKPHRSHQLIPLRSMPLAVSSVGESHIFSWDFTGADGVDVLAPAGGLPLTLIVHTDSAAADQLSTQLRAQVRQDPAVGSVLLAVAAAHPAKPRSASSRSGRGGHDRRRHNQLRPTPVQHRVLSGERTVTEPLPLPVSGPEGQRTTVELAPEGFWQIHRSAPKALTETVASMVQLSPGGRAADLYAGAGLFSAWAAESVGPGGQVLSVEAARASSAAAQQLFAGLDHIEVVTAPAERVVARLQPSDLVILDPPRAGADNRVLAGICASQPAQILYVSCDPASFARDAKRLGERGYALKDLRLLDMYPNTHHMESAALFEASS